MQDETHVGDDTEQVGFVFLVQRDGIVVVSSHQDLGPGALSGDLLLLVQGVLDGLLVLLQHHAVQSGQVGGIIPDGVLHQQDSLHTPSEHVVFGIYPVLQELDDRDDQVRGIVPAEDIVNAGTPEGLDLAIDFPGERREEYDGHVRVVPFRFFGKIENADLPDVIHGDHKVEALSPLEEVERFGSGLHPSDLRRVAEAQLRILL